MEAMAVEMLVDAYYQLQGYWTKLRYPIKTDKGAWSDIDVLAYNPDSKDSKEKELVICECKARKGKNVLISFDTKPFEEDYAIDFINKTNKYFNDPLINDYINKGFIKIIKFILIGNFYENKKKLKDIEKEFDEKLKEKFDKKLREKLNENNIKVCFEIKLTLDVICDLFIEIRKDNEHNKRYGHPILDFAREINRYLHPEKGKRFKKEFHSKFVEALGLDIDIVNKK
jgi:hypothetical protein